MNEGECMKKTLALVLSLILIVSLFAACGEKTTDTGTAGTTTTTPSTGTTEPSTGTTTPSTGTTTPSTGTTTPSTGTTTPSTGTTTPSTGTTTPSTGTTTPSTGTTEPAPTKVKATIDMTDLYTLVIKTVGASGDDRTGVRAAAGKIQAGVYSANGRTRTQNFEFDFASLGLPGYAWEYLGAEVEIDTSGAAPKITGTPVKSTFCVTREQITFDAAGKIATVAGVEFDISKINYGWLRTNTLLNEGGQFIPGWNDKATINSQSSTLFNSEKYIKSIYIFVNAAQFGQQMLVQYADTTYDKNAPLPEGVEIGVGTIAAPVPTVKATIDKTDLYTLVIKTVGASGDDRTGVRAAAGKIEAGVYAANGRTRTESYEFDFASLGLPGYAWQYLGAEVEIDASGTTPKIVNTPAKSMFCVTIDQITFDASGKKATVGGVDFDLTKINWGGLRTNTLLNEGGQYIPGWNDPSISSKDSGIFTSASRKVSLYFFVNVPLLKKQMCVSYADTTYDKNAPLPEGVTLPTK